MTRVLLTILMILVPLNVVGLDPADYFLIGIAPLIIALRPGTLLFHKLRPEFLYLAMIFFGSFVVSNIMGFDARFAGAIAINIAFFITLYFALVVHDQPINIGYIFSAGFIILTVVIFLIGLAGTSYLGLFDIFRNGRFLGTFGDPNFTGFAAVFVFIYFLDRVIESRSVAVLRALDILFMILGMVALLLTESRAAWGAGLIAALAYFSVMSGKRSKFIIPGLFAVMALSITVSLSGKLGEGRFGTLADRLQTIFVQNDSAEAERFEFLYTRISVQLGMDHPLGVGAGMTSRYTGLTSADGIAIGSHNGFIQIFAEHGWLAFGSLLIILALTVWRLLPRAMAGWMLNDVSCRVIFAMMMGQVVFAMAHDMIAWRIAWLVPAMAICAAFAREVKVRVAPQGGMMAGAPPPAGAILARASGAGRPD